MAQQLYLQVGANVFDNGENWIRVSRQSLIGQYGSRHARRHTWVINGVLEESGVQADIDTAMGERETWFSTDGQDVYLKFADATNTQHVLLNSSTVDGVRFKDFQWLDSGPERLWGAGTEYATKRTYRVIAEAEVVDQDGTDLFSFRESFEQIGNGGPDFAYPENLILPPTRQDTKNFTRGRAVQYGTAVGFLGYPTPTAPYYPGLVKPHNYRVRYETPQRVGSVRNTFFTVHWTYLFEADVAILAGPPALPAP